MGYSERPYWLEPTSRVIDFHSESGTTVSKKLLDCTTDSSSVADSESIATQPTIAAAKSSSTWATVTAQMMASHNIAITNLISRKNKRKGPKGKKKDTAPEPDTGIMVSDEDDSQEREAALSSSIKGKTSRELNQVQVN
jgi:hypothetical protein